jgi:hypothetical protein
MNLNFLNNEFVLAGIAFTALSSIGILVVTHQADLTAERVCEILRDGNDLNAARTTIDPADLVAFVQNQGNEGTITYCQEAGITVTNRAIEESLEKTIATLTTYGQPNVDNTESVTVPQNYPGLFMLPFF